MLNPCVAMADPMLDLSGPGPKALWPALMAAALSLTPAALAQVSQANVRALNTARETAISLNGGLPGWQQEGIAPTVETEIRVAPGGRTVVGIVHNGPPR
jgi:hypothetical protein